MAAIQKNQDQPTTPFNSSDCSTFLYTRHTVAMDALVASTTPPHEKPELYKPPGATNTLSGTWGSGKYTSMANGADFLAALLAKIDPQNSAYLHTPHHQPPHHQQHHHQQQHHHHHHHHPHQHHNNHHHHHHHPHPNHHPPPHQQQQQPHPPPPQQPHPQHNNKPSFQPTPNNNNNNHHPNHNYSHHPQKQNHPH